MLKLVTKLHGTTVQTLELSDPATIYWAGRNENCQIPLLADQGISRQHFKIFLNDGLWHIEVVSRFNDLQFGNNTVKNLTLREGTGFSLPPYEFTVEGLSSTSKKNELPISSLGEDSPSRVVSIIQHENQKIEDQTVTTIQNHQAEIVLIYRSPETKEERTYFLVEDKYQVGRDSACDIIIDDARVSRRQFQLVRSGGTYSLMDKVGVNSTYINKDKVQTNAPIVLQSGDRISVLNHRFKLEIRDPEFENKIKLVQHLTLVEPALPPETNDFAIQSPSEFEINNNPSNYYEPLQESQNGSAEPSNENPFPPTPTEPELKIFGLQIVLTKQNKIRLILFAIVFVVLIFVTTEDETNLDETKDVAERPADPFSKLTPEEQKQVKMQYDLAVDLFTKGNYLLANEELAKIYSKIPSYQDSADLERKIQLGIELLREREQQERTNHEAAEAEERILNTVQFCRQQINPNTTTEHIETCLAEAIQLNPEHEQILKIREDVGRIEEDRKTREAEELRRKAQAEEFRSLYRQALSAGDKDPLKGIEALKEFLKYEMADPDNLRTKALNGIKKLEAKIKEKVTAAIASVQGLVEAGNHKEAIMTLEKATVVAPDDQTLKSEITRLIEELRKQMQALYQEAILEENIGNIDTAKDRWKKIIDQDIPNGEYFGKAKIKLNKYGGG